MTDRIEVPDAVLAENMTTFGGFEVTEVKDEEVTSNPFTAEMADETKRNRWFEYTAPDTKEADKVVGQLRQAAVLYNKSQSDESAKVRLNVKRPDRKGDDNGKRLRIRITSK